jgi:hypothetical protein
MISAGRRKQIRLLSIPGITEWRRTVRNSGRPFGITRTEVAQPGARLTGRREPPKGELEPIHYFCGNTEMPPDLEEREPQRAAPYKATVAHMRAYANIADEMDLTGHSRAESARIKEQMDHYLAVRETVRQASGESIDLKAYEADMRHLIDTYIGADEPRRISPFDGMDLFDLIVKTGIAKAIAMQLGGLKGNKDNIDEQLREIPAYVRKPAECDGYGRTGQRV